MMVHVGKHLFRRAQPAWGGFAKRALSVAARRRTRVHTPRKLIASISGEHLTRFRAPPAEKYEHKEHHTRASSVSSEPRSARART